jgi:hypothetical protein
MGSDEVRQFDAARVRVPKVQIISSDADAINRVETTVRVQDASDHRAEGHPEGGVGWRDQ